MMLSFESNIGIAIDLSACAGTLDCDFEADSDMDDEGLYTMPVCNHEVLTLMPSAGPRLRCRHCHLTISAQELGSGCCPECLEALKVQRRDFEEIPDADAGRTRYRCEACGMILYA